MARLHTHYHFENQVRVDLFKQLFLFQVHLETYVKDGLEHRKKVENILYAIDELMHDLIEETEFVQD